MTTDERSTDDLAAELQALSIGDAHRSESARIRARLPEIMAAVTAGVRQRAIHAALVKRGCKLSFESFRTTLYRLRKKAAQPGQRGTAIPSVKPSAEQHSEDIARQYMSREPKNPILEMIEKEKTK